MGMKDIHSEEFARQFVADVAALPPVIIDVDPSTAVAIVAQLQLALRHPSNRGDTARRCREFLDRLIAVLGRTEVLRLGLAAGDNPAFDAEKERPG